MTDSLVLPAPAKLNLFLRVTGRRADGYHELQTVFQLLDWGDELRLAATAGEAIERLAPVPGVAEQDDLSLRAAEALQGAARKAGRPFGGARIALHKRIPAGGGLGGASSDAASVLLGLNHLWGCGFGTSELARLARDLGADVPVFVRGRSAWAEGIGDRLTPLALGPRWYVLVFPEEQAATAKGFADPLLKRDAPRIDPGSVTDLCALGNAFLPVLVKRSSRMAEMVEILSRHGTPRLTGSGSTLFLEVADEAAAQRLTSILKNHYNVRAVRGRDRSTVLDRLPRPEHES